ncbi:MAG: cupin domain-containing protein [Firmicutes bacterium]|nr:cupin domain-containing protein [Bacillota bacterium]MTI84838.1 cupin domain-containing protein [Bacillota bacterium]
MTTKIPDITRLYKGARHEFEVEVVFAPGGGQSPRESHNFDEIIVLTEGTITLERSDREEVVHYDKTPAFIEIPAGVEHVIGSTAPAKLVIIHPNRNV